MSKEYEFVFGEKVDFVEIKNEEILSNCMSWTFMISHNGDCDSGKKGRS